MRINAFDYFRAVAIAVVVVGHSFGPWSIDTFHERLIANLLSGGTTLFVFISGFFFHHVFYKNFKYADFLKKKIQNLLAPYFVLCLLGFLYVVVLVCEMPYAHDLGLAEHPDSFWVYLKSFFIYLYTGRIVLAYWFIPFIITIFALSPLFIYYIRQSDLFKIIVLLLCLMLSMIVHRPLHNISIIHSVVYFVPVYLLGILVSIHREIVMSSIKGKSLVLGLVVLFLAILQTIYHDGYGNLHKIDMFSYAGIDFLELQKITTCFLILSILNNYENTNISWLKYIASVSFALFFIHPWLIYAFHAHHINQYLYGAPGVIVFILSAISLFLLSLFIAYLVKVCLGKYSKYVIGW